MEDKKIPEPVENDNGKKTEQPNQKSKKIWVKVCVAAACAVVVVAIFVTVALILGNSNKDGEASAVETTTQEEIYETTESEESKLSSDSEESKSDVESSESKDDDDSDSSSSAKSAALNIYYVAGNDIKSSREDIDNDSDVVFDAWKKLNDIGDEVKLIDCKVDVETIDTNETVVDPDEYTPEKFRTIVITVSKNLEDYYSSVDEELLLMSLKVTMIEYSGTDFDACNIVLE